MDLQDKLAILADAAKYDASFHFLEASDSSSTLRSLDSVKLEHLIAPAQQQIDFYEAALSARTGEI